VLPAARASEDEALSAASDGAGVLYRPGDGLEMPAGSVHSLGVASSEPALVALLNGRIEMLGE
jgi:quercetin dioxygenase-like cupin family protein